MKLSIEKKEMTETYKQIHCYLDGKLSPEFFSFNSKTTDEEIDKTVRETLISRGYQLDD